MKMLVYGMVRGLLCFGFIYAGIALDGAWPGHGVAIGWFVGAMWAGIIAPALEDRFERWLR